MVYYKQVDRNGFGRRNHPLSKEYLMSNPSEPEMPDGMPELNITPEEMAMRMSVTRRRSRPTAEGLTRKIERETKALLRELDKAAKPLRRIEQHRKRIKRYVSQMFTTANQEETK